MASTDAASTEALSSNVTAVIVTHPRFIVRRWQASDAQSLSEGANNKRLVKYMTNAFPNPYTIDAAHFWIDLCSKEPDDKPLNFGIIDATNATVLGGVGLKPSADVYSRSNEVGYWLRESAWGKGLMTEVLRAFCAWAFRERPDIERLWAGVFDTNRASEQVLRKVGFVHEGTLRKMVWKHDQFWDQQMYALIREDYEKQARQ